MSDWQPLNRWRHRCEFLDGAERLILQVQERRAERGFGYTVEPELRWRDAVTTDLALPQNECDARPSNAWRGIDSGGAT